MILLKRAYHAPGSDDGRRILVDRLWPRGLSKEHARVDEWYKEVAPSDSLRKWFGHDPAKWKEFQERYRQELAGKTDLVDSLRRMAKEDTVTLLYAAKDDEHNNAVVLKDLLTKGNA